MLTQHQIDRLIRSAQITLHNNHPTEQLGDVITEIERARGHSLSDH